MKQSILATAVFLVATLGARAQTYEKILIPAYLAAPLEGAHGSVWESRLAVANRSDEPVMVFAVEACQTEPCGPPTPIPGQTTVFPTFNRVSAGAMWGLVAVESARRNDVAFSLRLYDTSRALGTRGTSIPVVYEDEFFADDMTLLDVPNDNIGRVTIRVYDIDPKPGDGVTVRVYATDPENKSFELSTRPDTLLAQKHAVFGTTPAGVPPGAIVLPLEAIATTSMQLLRLEIVPDDHAKKYWAFGSVTNNDTQHVTLLLPK